jgi:TolB protein
LRRVTTVPIDGLSATDLSFCWSPDGSQLLYPSNDKLLAVRTDGTGLRTVSLAPFGRLFAGCDWVETGNRIVARTTGSSIYDNDIALVEDGGGFRRLFKKPGRVSNPTLSPDGKFVLVSHDIAAFENTQGRQLDARLMMIDAITGSVKDLSVDKLAGTNDLEPRLIPTGSRVIFTNTDNTDTGVRDVFTTDLEGKNRARVVQRAEMVFPR